MTLSRRDLLRSLLALPVAATVDWEQLLWVPKPIVVVPAMPLSLAEIHAATLNKIMPAIMDNFFKADPLFKYFSERSVKAMRYKAVPAPLAKYGVALEVGWPHQ